MARIRSIKPEFFTSEEVVDMPPHVRLLYIALWCESDREGRFVWKPRTIKMRYFPADNFDINEACEYLVSTGHVVLYGDGLAYIPTFATHQHVNPRESKSVLPAPPGLDEGNKTDGESEDEGGDSDDFEVESPRVTTRHDASNLDLHAQVGKERKGRNKDASARDASTPVLQTRSAERFAEFWLAWPPGPRKQARAECEKKWKARGLDSVADQILAHLVAISGTKQFQDFTPAPLTYLNQRRWEDGLPSAQPDPVGYDQDSLFRGCL